MAPASGQGERFHLSGAIGLGGAGCVYKAWDDVLCKTVALKMVQLAGPAAEMQLRREAAVAQSLTHPSIVRIHDVVCFRGQTCISMEYVNGTDLAAYLSERRKLDVHTVAHIAGQICSGLAAAHDAGIIHCDLKPANIMLEDDRVRIVDFGLAVELNAPASERTWAGTPVYMSPEQKQRVPVDRRTDFYSLGLILFELLSGRRPTAAELDQVTPAKLRQPLQQVPRWMREIIAKCLQHGPQDRYASASEISADLRRFSNRSSSPLAPDATNRKQNASRIAACAAVLLPLVTCVHNGHVIAGPTGSKLDSQGPQTVVLLPIQPKTSSSEPLADGLSDYLRDALGHSPELHLWTPNPQSNMSPGSTALHKADLIITGTVDEVGDYSTVHLDCWSGVTGTHSFSVPAGGSTPYELQQKLWSELLSHVPRLQHAETKASRDEISANVQSYGLYLRGNHLIHREPGSIEALRKAVELLNAAIAVGPSCALCYARKADAELLLADLNHDEKWMRDVLSDVHKAREINENSEDVVSTAAQVYARTDRRNEAIMLLQNAKKLTPSSARIRHLLGELLAEQGLYAEALSELNAAVELDPTDVAHLNILGVIELQIPDYAAAIDSFTRISQIDPGNIAASVNLASTYIRAARFADAVNPAEKALQRDASAPNYTNLAIATYYVGKQQLALLLFQQAARLSPNSEVYVGNLAHAYRWLGMQQEARTTYRHALDLALQEIRTKPDSSVLADVALYEAALGKVETANAYIAQARSTSPSDLDVMYKEAVVADLLGTPQRALDVLKKVCARGYPMALASNNPDLAEVRQLPGFQTLAGGGTQPRPGGSGF
ncbi:MAG: protein kinase [Acidobacteriaceae bacterium]|nr:protein kinase [Acidobacteriaceae bacterium]